MIKLNSISDNGIAWLETECGKIFAVLDAFKILDYEGFTFLNTSAVDKLEHYTDVEQDWDNEANLIQVITEDGENATLKIDADGVELIA